ncbi:uncharacterized protein N7477_000901 [Penicillium maclennaniae]|uniref:uncharacterized protein n=1 Tax=Penicillium maclennaniae TaxID=1343394 RepID=UPI0025410EE1|nr:uncharacterized protein N7477_000901 [Penicillium maclennaniae]KAJ5684556.1 hypothetical protein N7477_000901 [Penicillium maclennaniae]
MRAFQLLAIGSAVLPAIALTPEQLISAPRRSTAVPNPSGEVALFSTGQYSFESHESTNIWNLIDLKSGKISELTDDSNVSEIIWLGSSNSGLLYINSTNAGIPGGVELWISDTADFKNSRYKAASLPASLSGLKTATTRSGDINFLVYGQSYGNGTAYNDKLAVKPLSTARIYDSIYPRHWDTWLTTTFNAVFSGTLELKTSGQWATSHYAFGGSLKNLVSTAKNLESPYPPYGDSTDYDISPDGQWVAFKSKAPRAAKGEQYRKPEAINGPDSSGTPQGVKGDSSGPVFSPDSKQLAYFQMTDIAYESDRRTLYVYTIGSKETIPALAKDWDRSPSAAKWTTDGKSLILNTEDRARNRLFILPSNAGDDFVPATLLMVAPRIMYTATPEKGITNVIFSANKVDPALKGMSPADVDEFYYEGNWTDIHSWIIYPQDFDKSKKYPLLFYIHGGPQGSWADSWSTRWNYKVWADQGYVVVAPNPTGSTGFGDKLTDMITNNWGSYPYDDLVKCWEYVRDNFEFIDTDNGVAAGASYGGFMINWIQGNPLGRKFKALVSHDGTFVADAKISTEELWFIEHDFNGTFWGDRDNYRRWDPSAPEHIVQMDTPQLIIHSDLDFRLPISEGLSLFNVLQMRGVPSRLLNFPDENHWVTNQENSLVWHQQVLGWINKYSGVGASNPNAVSLDDTIIPVVDYNPYV